MRTEHLNLRNEDKSKKFDAKIPRYHEWVVKEEEKKVCIFDFIVFTVIVVIQPNRFAYCSGSNIIEWSSEYKIMQLKVQRTNNHIVVGLCMRSLYFKFFGVFCYSVVVGAWSWKV